MVSVIISELWDERNSRLTEYGAYSTIKASYHCAFAVTDIYVSM